MESLTDATALRDAETALHGIQAELGSVFDTAAEGIVVAGEDGRITSVNQAALHLFGYGAAADLVGQDLGMLMPHTSVAHHGDTPSRDIGVSVRELLALRRDGTEFPIELSVSSFSRTGRHYLTAIIRDITVRRQAEAELRDSEARLRLVQSVGRIGAVDRLLPDGVALISTEFATLAGLPAGTTRISTAQLLSLVHPEDRHQLHKAASSVHETGGRFEAKFRLCRPDGSVRWHSMQAEILPGPDGTPNRIISAHSDITDIVEAREELERHVAERTAELASTEARFRAIFDAQFQFIGLLNTDGTLVEANRTALDAAGLTRDDVIGQPFWKTAWWPIVERDRLRQEIRQAAAGALIRREVRVIGAGGRDIWIDFSLKPVRAAEGGELAWIIPEGRDITEQRSLSNQLMQAQRMQALGQLAGGIAHDFNNILQSVSGAAKLIERRPDDRDRVQRLARMAVEAATRGASITRRLLSFARCGELRAEILPTAEVLDNIREVLAHALGSAITVRCQVAVDIPPLIVDRGQFETVLVNLGTNARDAMPNGGTLTLSAEVDHVRAGNPAGLKPGTYVRLSVTDTGLGMDEVTLAQATEPFFTTKPGGEGTGLGLSMAKTFAEQSGGAMSISSAPGKGTTITLWLCPATSAVVPLVHDDGDQEVGSDKIVRVPLVDDDDMVRETLAAQVEEYGCRTLVAAGGAEAIALLEAGEAVDALVSDLSMPDMDGVTTIQKARTLRPRLPCFLLTGYAGDRAALAGGDAFTLIRKPVTAQTLVARIEAGVEAAKGAHEVDITRWQS
ncbi:MAG: PAS domain S-box protein [Rhodopila sp.]